MTKGRAVRVALVYTERTRWPKFRWVHDALERLGHPVRAVRTANELREADAWAELVIFQHKAAGLCPADILAVAPDRHVRWAQWFFDLVATDPGQPLAGQALVKAFLPIMRAMDAVFVKERGLLGQYREFGVNAAWLDQGCPSTMPPCEHAGRPEFDVVLWGSVRGYRQRIADVKSVLQAGFSVAWAGRPSGNTPPGVVALPFVPPLQLPELASRGAVVLCVDYRHDLDGYWSDRVWLALGMGACVVRRWTPGMNPALPLYTYNTGDELIEIVGRLRGDVDHRRAIGRAAREFVMAGATIEHRARELLRVVEEN